VQFFIPILTSFIHEGIYQPSTRCTGQEYSDGLSQEVAQLLIALKHLCENYILRHHFYSTNISRDTNCSPQSKHLRRDLPHMHTSGIAIYVLDYVG
jgi:hypothetical protein